MRGKRELRQDRGNVGLQANPVAIVGAETTLRPRHKGLLTRLTEAAGTAAQSTATTGPYAR
jgi:hypothetical protein